MYPEDANRRFCLFEYFTGPLDGLVGLLRVSTHVSSSSSTVDSSCVAEATCPMASWSPHSFLFRTDVGLGRTEPQASKQPDNIGVALLAGQELL